MAGSSRQFRFGAFEVDLDQAELRKQGLRIRLQEQPFQVLAALLERPGEVVSREELVRRLWADGTIVDFDRGLNAAVTRLRQALSDSAETPRYVETVARRGYRFIGLSDRPPERSASEPAPMAVRRHSRLWLAAIPVVIILGTLLVEWLINYRKEFDKSFKATPLTAATGVERNPSFSPEGAQLAYEWNRGGHRHLYLKVVGPGDPIPLTDGDGAEYGPAWSPDGKWIAFLGQKDHSWAIYVIAPVGGTLRKVADVAGLPMAVLPRQYRFLDWTRDSRHVISSVLGQGDWESLLLVSVDTGEKTWLTGPNGATTFGDREPAVSPDGRTVAFARGLVDSERLYLLALTADLRPVGQPRPMVAAGRGRSPAWLPGGHELIFSTANSGAPAKWALFYIDLASGEPPRQLAPNAATPAVSSRGSLTYSTLSFESTFWRQEIPSSGGSASPPIPVTSAAVGQLNPEYSPNGTRIAFASERSGTRQIWNCASGGSHCLQATSMNGHTLTGYPRWSPDGKQIVFHSAVAGVLDPYVVDANGGAARRLTTGVAHGRFPFWSHDGKWIYYSGNGGKPGIWKISPAGGEATRVTRNGDVAMDSPDSKTLYYSDGGKFFRSNADGSGEAELPTGSVWWGFAVARDRIYYIHEDSEGVNEIRQVHLSTGVTSLVCRIDKLLTAGLSLSPDGKSLLYAELRRRGNLMVAQKIH